SEVALASRPRDGAPRRRPLRPCEAHARQGPACDVRRAQGRGQARADGRRRPLAHPDLPRDAVYQVSLARWHSSTRRAEVPRAVCFLYAIELVEVVGQLAGYGARMTSSHNLLDARWRGELSCALGCARRGSRRGDARGIECCCVADELLAWRPLAKGLARGGGREGR